MRDRGSLSAEMVLLTPVLIVVLLFVVHAGRTGTVVEQVRHAADQGARAASLVSHARRDMDARSAVTDDLRRHGIGCEAPTIDVAALHIGFTPAVRVTVECGIDLSGLDLLGVRERRVVASSTEAIDIYRGGS